ncbi:MAG: MATE family efflux transporter [Clostridia bacterium]|nr:MATE family efflux transporter [Clostridia bacterium]
MRSAHTIDLARGNVLKCTVSFALPILLTALIQRLYHSADLVVVGNFADDGDFSLAAVGASTAITGFLGDLFIGLSTGSNVLCARARGAGDEEAFARGLKTAMILSLISGLVLGSIGFFLATPLLRLLDCPSDLLEAAALYMKIIFLAQPASMVYHFGASVLRSNGDTRRPMWILTASGVLNVLLNLLFVMGLGLDHAGVGIATAVSQYASALAVLYILFHPAGEYRALKGGLRFDGKSALQIAKVGLPCGIGSSMYSFSNVLISSAVNSFGTAAVAGNAASTTVSSFLSLINMSTHNTAVSFVAQNHGAGRFDRVDRFLRTLIPLTSVLLLALTAITLIFSDFFLGFFTEDPAVRDLAFQKLLMLSVGHCINVSGELFAGSLEGFGKTAVPTVTNFCCVAAVRILWPILALPLYRAFWFLFLCYPLSYFLASVANAIYFLHCRKRVEREYRLAKEVS